MTATSRPWALAAALLLGACEGPADPERQNPVTRVHIAAPDSVVHVGATLQLSATPENALGDTLRDRRVEWSTSEPRVARVSTTGLAEGVAPGVAIITARSGKASAELLLRVLAPVAEVKVTAPDTLLWTGRTLQLSAALQDASGEAIQARGVEWFSSDTGVARVSQSGVVTGVAEGRVRVGARSEGKSGDVTIRVVPGIAYCSVTMPGHAVPLGTARQATASPRGARGNSLAGRRVTWSISDPAVATVSDSGLVRAVGLGSATLEGSCEGVVGRLTVVVARGYTLTSLGTLGGASSRALDVNERGEVVGESQTASGATRAFLWSGGRMTDLGSPEGSSRATALNERGQVVGVYWSGPATAPAYRPFLWENGAIRSLDPSPPEEDVHATDIDDQGRVVGYSETTGTTYAVGSALVWQNGHRTDLGRMGGYNARLIGIDDQGRMLGVVNYPAYLSPYACVSARCSSFLLSGATRTEIASLASAISSNAMVTGIIGRGDPTIIAAFRWRDGSLTTYDRGRRTSMVPTDVNREGAVIGNSSYYMGGTHAFVWHGDSFLPIPEILVDAEGWRELVVTAINDRGQIVGHAKKSGSGEWSAVLLDPRP